MSDSRLPTALDVSAKVIFRQDGHQIRIENNISLTMVPLGTQFGSKDRLCL